MFWCQKTFSKIMNAVSEIARYQVVLYHELLDIKIFCIRKCKYLPAESVEQNKQQESKTESKHGLRRRSLSDLIITPT